jgi:hypothetical protein
MWKNTNLILQDLQALTLVVMLTGAIKDDAVALSIQPQIFHPEVIPILRDQWIA